MAEEWWNSARTGGNASTCSTAPATESEASSSTSINFQPCLSDAASSSSSFLADPHMDWTQAFTGGKAAAAESTTSFNALLQLQGDASHHFLLDGEAPLVPAPYADGTALTAVAASSQGLSLYADNQYSGSASSYAFSQLLKSSAASVQHQHQQFPGFFSSSGPFGTAPEPPQLLLQALEPKPVKDLKSNTEPVQDACSSVTRTSVSDSPAAVKKPRIATPSPLPTFKVRKEKLGDRITALQQLVSPFGKTDTASVLHEAIKYIKFLHDQVASLSSPYLRCGRPVQLQHKQGSDKTKEGGEAKQDLRSRGLYLVPVASTYTVASETAPEFWHPTFGGTFR